MAWAEDLRLIGQALNLSKEQLAHVSSLGVGEAVVSLRWLQNPILVQVEGGLVLSRRGGTSAWSRSHSRNQSLQGATCERPSR